MKFSIFYRKEKVYSKNAPTVCLIIAVVLKAHKGRLKVFQQPVFHCSILCRGVHIKIIFNERGRENNLNQQFGSFFAYLFFVAYSPFFVQNAYQMFLLHKWPGLFAYTKSDLLAFSFSKCIADSSY